MKIISSEPIVNEVLLPYNNKLLYCVNPEFVLGFFCVFAMIGLQRYIFPWMSNR